MQVVYVGDGGHYVPGRPAVAGAVEDVSDEQGAALIETGLYEPVEKKGKKPPSTDPAAPAAPAGGD